MIHFSFLSASSALIYFGISSYTAESESLLAVIDVVVVYCLSKIGDGFFCLDTSSSSLFDTICLFSSSRYGFWTSTLDSIKTTFIGLSLIAKQSNSYSII